MILQLSSVIIIIIEATVMSVVHKIEIQKLIIIIDTPSTMSVTSYEFKQNNAASSIIDIGLPEGATFGTLKIHMAQKQMITTPTTIQFTLDHSNSMIGEKLTQLIRTVTNILRVIVECNMPFSVKIDAFHSAYTKIIPLTVVTKENMEELITKVSAIRASKNTNIENAFIQSQADLDPTAYHFFLTDGEPTDGAFEVDILTKLVREDITAFFIGYGEDHNAELLSKCANKNAGNSSYQLVTQVETIGDLCGELLNEICYPALKEVVITTNNPGEYLFHPITNEWTNKIVLNQLISDKEYTFFICSLEPFTGVVLSGIDPNSGNIEINELFSDSLEPVDLTIDLFKFKTNSLLADAIVRKEGVYEELSLYFNQIHRYAREKGLLEDPAFKIMFDDIFLTYSKYHTSNGMMYALSRDVSNRRQQNYRVSSQTPTNVYVLERTVSQHQIARSISVQDYDEDIYNEEHIDDDEDQDEAHLAIDILPSIDIDDISLYVPNESSVDISSTQTMRRLIRQVAS